MNSESDMIQAPYQNLVNYSQNRIHEWEQPEQNSLTRFFLTRLGNVFCCPLEVFTIVCSIGKCTLAVGKGGKRVILNAKFLIFPKTKSLLENSLDLESLKEIKKETLILCRRIAGWILTMLFGIFISPEVNFRLHKKLGLAIDNLAIMKEKQLQTQLEAEIKAEQISKARSERFALFQAERQRVKNAEEQEQAIDAHLAEFIQRI